MISEVFFVTLQYIGCIVHSMDLIVTNILFFKQLTE
jgi:hypothetical protein